MVEDPARLTRLMAVACGVTAANQYFAQPLLDSIGSSLRVSHSGAALVVTASQAGFAIGLLVIVPSGDILRRRPLITWLLAVCVAALLGAATAPSLLVLVIFVALVSLTSVVVQLLVPYAATLADDATRAQVIGTLMAGMLTGILLSRTFAGVIAQFAGWRAVYATAAAIDAVTVVALRLAMPDHSPQLDIGYLRQLRGVVAAVSGEPVLRWRAAIVACEYAAFGCFWTTVTFLLAAPPYRFTQLEIGLFALAGAAGAATASQVGRWFGARPGRRWPATGVALGILVASFGLIGLAGASFGLAGLIPLVAAALIMDAAVQAVHVINQSVVYELLPQARSRLATVYITALFLGAAAGAAAGAQGYDRWGWPGATTVAAGFGALGLLAWLAGRRHERT
jgi:predicted MFS family arabinose efflux permease